MNILANEATPTATALLPSFGFAEKRGSMINGKGRLQRLNRAVRAPGQARDDWEILRDLIQACSGQNGIYSIEDVFRQMSESIPQFTGLSLSKISDLGVQVMETETIEAC
jgi:NADH-quinone oxidoreductase subunit G